MLVRHVPVPRTPPWRFPCRRRGRQGSRRSARLVSTMRRFDSWRLSARPSSSSARQRPAAWRGNRRRGHRHGIRRRWRLRQIDDRFRTVRRGRDCSGSRQAWDGQCRADDHDDASQHEPRPPCQSVGGRRWTRRRRFRGRCHVFGSRRCFFHGEVPQCGRGFPQVARLGHDKRDARQSRSTRLFRGPGGARPTR